MDDRTDPSSHTNYCMFTSPEEEDRLKRLHREVRIMQHKLERLKEKISDDAARANTIVDSGLDADLISAITENDTDVMKTYPEGFFQRVFWNQQKKAESLKDSRAMKWHLLFIKWCLYLHHISGKEATRC